MTVAGVATSHTKKLFKFTLSIIRPRFNSSKCKTAAKMAVARIKLLRNKREVVVRQMRRDLALLLQSGQDSTARVRVEHVIREQNVLAANEFVELFCELVVSRLTIIAKRKECPADLKEGISSLIFAAPRCSEIPELIAIRDIFEKKYGKDFVSAATDLRPSCGVNRVLIDKLSVRTPSGEVKLKVLKEIAKEHQIDWDTEESEKELLKPPEELIEGPQTFVSASSLPVKPAQNNPVEPNKPFARPTNEGEMRNMHFQDSTSAAEAAAEAAKQAVAAANAAAFLANKGNPASQAPFHGLNASGIHHTFSPFSGDTRSLSMPNNAQSNNNASGRMYESHHYGSLHQENNKTGSVMMDNEHTYRRHSHNETKPVLTDRDNLYRRHSYNDTRPVQMDNQNASRRDSCNSLSPHSDIKFDESDYDSLSPHSDIKFDESDYPPPERPPPPAPSSHGNQNKVHRAHPKLPDYDALTARFEALKFHKSRT